MDKFIVSARKYRPQNFSTVVGQEHITTTLKNAIKNNQLAHAFLFCGPRGVGKTTCARILAKTINCENITKSGEACNKCPSCVSFNDGGSLNIHELDAASNNSVDDIRTLVEQVRFSPQAGKYKVYIIDEVHMLSASAFNAFLKTLEEPPPYAIFILATTEKHKILPTILSRCQIFDFKRITLIDTVTHLMEICDKEDIKAEKPALQVIAQKSEGCLRDALSILDKIVSFTNGEVSYANTLEHLNILDADYYFKLIDSMLGQDLASILLLYDDINRKGFEGDLVLNGFMEFLRNILVCQDEKVADLLEVVESFKDRYISTAKKISPAYIISSLNILNEADINFKGARNKRLHVELTLIKLCYLQQALELSVTDNITSKKKLTDKVTPLAFKNLPIIEFRKTESQKKEELAKSFPVSDQQDAVSEARLLIETTKPVVPSATTTEKAEALVEVPKPISTKLGALSKIRQHYSKSNGAETAAIIRPLALEELQNAWIQYTEILREAKNPAVQSFDRASFNIVNTNLFEVISNNNLEQKFIEQQRLSLCEHLQAWFNNKSLSYSLLIKDKTEPTEKFDMPLNSREQFQKLAELYPLIRELKDRLRLELDY
ncbi:MAG: DNA polymerase III subunit gamma/tau [Chitinophagaceae bacterium]